MIALLLGQAILPPPAPVPVSIAVQAEAPAQEVWELDQIRIARDTDPKTLKAIEPDHSLEAVITTLKRLGITYTRARVSLLPDQLPESVRAQIIGLRAGEPFVVPSTDFMTINVLVGRRLPADAIRWHRRLPLTPIREA